MTKTLLMIHGVGCGGDVWDRMIPVFEADGWTCEAPTLFPGRRLKTNPPASLSELGIDDYISAMSAKAHEIEKATGEKPAVIGHSMGGLIAQVLAEKGDVSQAVFLTPAQPKGCAVVGPSVAFTFLNILIQQNRKKSYKVWRTGFDFGVTNCVPKRLREEIYSHALYDSGKVYGDLTDGVEIDESRIKIPTLTIAARKDRATLASAVRKVGEKYSRAPVAGDFMEYPKNGHWIVDEPGTDKVAADIAGWLARTRVKEDA